MKKPIKEWGVVKFLTDKLPDAAGKIAETALGIATGQNPVRAISDLLVGRDELSAEDREKARQLLADDLEREKLIDVDRANARSMQVEIATSEDSGWLAQNFIYLMSTFVLLAATFFGVSLTFVEIPDANRRLVEMFADVFLFAGAVAVLQYFIGRPNLKGFKQVSGRNYRSNQ